MGEWRTTRGEEIMWMKMKMRRRMRMRTRDRYPLNQIFNLNPQKKSRNCLSPFLSFFLSFFPCLGVFFFFFLVLIIEIWNSKFKIYKYMLAIRRNTKMRGSTASLTPNPYLLPRYLYTHIYLGMYKYMPPLRTFFILRTRLSCKDRFWGGKNSHNNNNYNNDNDNDDEREAKEGTVPSSKTHYIPIGNYLT